MKKEQQFLPMLSLIINTNISSWYRTFKTDCNKQNEPKEKASLASLHNKP